MPQCFNRLRPGEGETVGEEQEQEEGSRWGKGFMVERIRARQSATSLLGAQARAGVWPESQSKVSHSLAEMLRRLILRTSKGLTFLIHSQHRGSSTQQCLHHRRQSVARCEMQGPGRGGRTEPGLLLTLTPNPGPAQASQGHSRLLPKVVRRCCNKGFRSRTTGNLDIKDNRVDSENGETFPRGFRLDL